MAASERAEYWDPNAVANEVMAQRHMASNRTGLLHTSGTWDGRALTAIMKHNAAAGERLHNQ